MTCVRTVDIGPYLLGAVSASQRLEFEEHLETCPLCREEIVRLAGIPGLLWRASSEDRSEPVVDVPELREDEARPMPRRRYRRVAAVVAAFAIVGGTVAGLDLTAARPRAPVASQSAHRASSTLSATDPSTHVSATAVLTDQAWGTGVRLNLQGLPYGIRCELVVHASDGSSDVAATWNAAYSPRLDIPAATDTARSQIAKLEVTTASQHLVTLPG